MGTFGVEGIRNFANLRASGMNFKKKPEDLPYTFNICNGIYRELKNAGHTCRFYWANRDCWEIDLRRTDHGGIDDDWADNVDLFFICTHGNHDSNGKPLLAYDINRNDWIGNAIHWHLGNRQCEWLMMYACSTIDLNNVLGVWDVFQRLHEICGAWDYMYWGWTTEECGEDVGDNLTDGDAVSSAWLDGVSDWWVDNHPIVVAAEREISWNNGNFLWALTTMNRDHLWGHGNTVSDIFPSDKYWISWRWAEG